ncbi:MAG: UDP-N-acetylmuramoyl-L-alanine--D-glutamate ligase [Eubacteriales bacterium]|nr:UDP-N-acetylmuramoyl-L-alanine--D-glutamate ligase [Eubacteriales bacterium]
MMYSENALKNKTAAVVGLGASNLPLIDYLLAHDVTVTARDIKSRDKLGSAADGLEQKGVRVICGEGYLDNLNEYYIFRTPGIRYDKPEIARAVASGSVLTSEMELFFHITPAKIIGVTGSDGKTTTSTLIYKMLTEAKKHVYLGGNIGRPLLPEAEAMSGDDIAVVELSSFQLHTMTLSPDISVITNISPNHLDYHLSMDEYVSAKKNIFLHERNRKLVLKYNDTVTRAMAEEARPDAEVLFFMSENGIHTKNGLIYYREHPVIPVSDILLLGTHNAENYMAAIGAAYEFISREDIGHVAQTFGGVEHRCELVRRMNGVSYYNSSIDSTPTRTIAALGSFNQKVIIICGGYDKQIPFEPLAEPLCRMSKAAVLTGATGAKIKAALDAYPGSKPDIYERPDFTDAVMTAVSAASDGDIVLLSPACASFDAFPNFEARGSLFKNIINNL